MRMRFGVVMAAPLILALAGCDVDPRLPPGPGMVYAQAQPSPPGAPAVEAARQACGLAVAGPSGLIRVEHQREASFGAMVILHARRDPASGESQRWRCNFEAATGQVRARAVS